jgi:hypothetical protein
VQVLAEKQDSADVEPLIKLIVDPGWKVSCGSSSLSALCFASTLDFNICL